MSNLKYLPLPEYQHHTETGRPQRRTVSVVKALTIATLTVIAVYHLLPSLEKPIPSSPVEVDQLDGHGFNWTSVSMLHSVELAKSDIVFCRWGPRMN